jgi:hypothetical protein
MLANDKKENFVYTKTNQFPCRGMMTIETALGLQPFRVGFSVAFLVAF